MVFPRPARRQTSSSFTKRSGLSASGIICRSTGIERTRGRRQEMPHHRAYFDKFYAAIKGTEFENLCLLHIFDMVSELPAVIRNNGGGFYNHKLFWKIIGPDCGGMPTGKIAEAINLTFGSFQDFQTMFTEAATNRFGSGWAWLIVRHDGSLAVTSTPNQDNPLMDIADVKGVPILALDVWEHAYYLKYQNRRMDYINAFWNVVNWDRVSIGYERATE